MVAPVKVTPVKVTPVKVAPVKSRPITDEEKEELWQLDRQVPASRSRRIAGSGATSEYRLRHRSSPAFAALRAYAVGLVDKGVTMREVAWELSMTPQAIRKWVEIVRAEKAGETA